MADIDFSKYSNEELMKIAQGGSGGGTTASAPQQQEEEPGFFKKLGKGYLNYAGGALRGMGQAAGDLGASAINWPISGIEHLSGHKLPHVPHPDLINKNPGSLGESIGQTLGQITGGLALPGGAGMKAAQLAGKGYQALRAGKQLPLIGKLLAGGAGGALEGAAGNEENRGLGGALGSIAGTAGYALPAAYNFAKSLGSKSIAKNIQEEVGRLGQHFNERFTSHLQAGEEAGANKFLRGEKGNIKLLKKAGEGKLAYGLEKFNEAPTLTNAHKAQSDLNKIVSKYSRSKEGSLEADVHAEALKLKNRLLKKISESFEKAGVKEHGVGYQQSRVDYANEAAPYLDSPTINGLLGKNKRGVQTVRPKEFADKLLQEEEFLAQSGNKHPDLLRREKYNKIKKNKLAQGAALGTGTLATGFLPYEIRKLLGTH
jgi:hypothetical protein